MARTLAQCGAAVAIHYHQNEALATTLAEELKSLGVRALPVQADITDLPSVSTMRDRITQTLGPADIIVNNAVSQYQWTSVLEQSPADYEAQFRTCVLHNLYMVKTFVPAMITRNWGRVIAINTECTALCNPNTSAYISGKGGQDRLLRVLAKEVGPHQITVNQIAPGWMISQKDRSTATEHNEGYEKNVPLHRRGTDQDIANLVAYLASDLANFISGVYIPVSGGTVMPGI